MVWGYERKLSVPTKYWNAKTQRAKEKIGFPDHERINQTLQNIQAIALDSYSRFKNEYGREPGVDELRNIIKEKRGLLTFQKEEKNFLFVRSFILNAATGQYVNIYTSRRLKPITIRTNRQTLGLIESFSKAKGVALELGDINLQFYKKFLHFLNHEYVNPETGKYFMTNTIGKHITNIKNLYE